MCGETDRDTSTTTYEIRHDEKGGNEGKDKENGTTSKREWGTLKADGYTQTHRQ